jgi:chromosome segregation ATPase
MATTAGGQEEVTTPDARLARLEEQLRGVREDIGALHTEVERARTRLHNLEGIAQTFVDAQNQNRRREAEQYRRLGNLIGLGSLLMAAAMVVLTLVTVLAHH